MYQHNFQSALPSQGVAASHSGLPIGHYLSGGDPQWPVQQLREAIVVLFAALSSTLNDERDSAEDCLGRAAEILRTVDAATHSLPKRATTGGLAPWQIRTVTSHIEAHLDMPIKSSELAVVARLSPCHFSRVFRDSFGCSPLEYVTRRRVEHAQGLMLSGDAPLSQIALDCGFADQAHFSRLFHRVVGESPRSWRRARSNPCVPHSNA
jgi:AraC-like DNA-binding protein